MKVALIKPAEIAREGREDFEIEGFDHALLKSRIEFAPLGLFPHLCFRHAEAARIHRDASSLHKANIKAAKARGDALKVLFITDVVVDVDELAIRMLDNEACVLPIVRAARI